MKIKNIFTQSLLIIALLINGCEDKEAEEQLVVESFSITMVDKITIGDGTQSQPELIRFVTDELGVIVNSKQNSVDFINITPSGITMSGQSVQITQDADADASSIDVSVDESILAVVVSKGACLRGELYLIDTSSLQKYGPYELGFNPDAVDIAVENKFVVVVIFNYYNRFVFGDSDWG